MDTLGNFLYLNNIYSHFYQLFPYNECLKASELISDRDIDVLSIIITRTKYRYKKYHKVLVYCTGYCDIIRGELSKNI